MHHRPRIIDKDGNFLYYKPGLDKVIDEETKAKIKPNEYQYLKDATIRADLVLETTKKLKNLNIDLNINDNYFNKDVNFSLSQ